MASEPPPAAASRWQFTARDLLLWMLAAALLLAVVRHFLRVLLNFADPTPLVLGVVMLTVAVVVGRQISAVPGARALVIFLSLAQVLAIVYDPNIPLSGDHTRWAFCMMALGLLLGSTQGLVYGTEASEVNKESLDD